MHHRYHNYEFKCQWISHYPFIYENEWNHNSYEMQFLKCKCAKLTEFYQTRINEIISASVAQVSRMVKCPHSLTFKFDSDMTYFFSLFSQ
jgi:hypothetical protein